MTSTGQKKPQLVDGQSPLMINNGDGAHARRRQDGLALEMAAVDSNEGIHADVGSD